MARRDVRRSAAMVCFLLATQALAAVSPEEAARLKSDLTPFGAEKAGNKDGSIPAWTGGYTAAIPGDVPGGRRGDPFKDEKPLYTITSANMAQYADKLSDGVKAMIRKYPGTYRLDIYPSHRTAAAPPWVYADILKNAVSAQLDGDVVTHAYGGIPFPIPKNGLEAIWNHKLSWRGSSWEADISQYQITASGQVVLVTSGKLRHTMPFYFEEGSAETFRGPYWTVNLVNDGPPIRAGEMIVGQQFLDDDKSQAYVYLTGQRRVRKLPNACCDTPTPASAGLMSFDELSVFQGRTNLFDWKLAGRKEMFVPYNENRFLQAKDADIIVGQHLDPKYVRWELHRVWVVEARLKAGERHQAPKSVYYLDEDTWEAMLGDRWDAKGQLWKTLWQFNYVMPDFPGAIQQTFGYYDLLSGQAYVSNVMNDKPFHQRTVARWPSSLFTGDGLAAQGVR